MVKRSLFVFTLGTFLVFLAPGAVIAKSAVKATAQVVSPTPPLGETGEVLAATAVKKSDYVLAYPGIFIDHPLYFLKRLRDQILERLIVDPIRKAEFHILQADKFLNMGMMLKDQGKTALAGWVITKAETYMQQAVGELVAIRGNGTQIPGRVTDRIEKSTGKHIEVLTDLLTKIDTSQKQAVTDALTLVKKLQGDLPKLK